MAGAASVRDRLVTHKPAVPRFARPLGERRREPALPSAQPLTHFSRRDGRDVGRPGLGDPDLGGDRLLELNDQAIDDVFRSEPAGRCRPEFGKPLTSNRIRKD
jgi:hypothetical protein